MKTDERLSGALQENVLVVLCFDTEHARLVRAAVTPQLFDSAVYKEVAGIAIDYIDQYQQPVGEHLPDHLEHILKGEDSRKAASYERLVKSLHAASERVNGEYVCTQLQKFVRQQNMKSAVVQAVEALRDDRIDDAELLLQKGLNSNITTFSPGLNFSADGDILNLLDGDLEEEGFNLGIKEFDRVGAIPRRKEQTFFLAPRGRGKSWFATHCAKLAMIQGWGTLIVSLEMSEKRYAMRMFQSFFSISQRDSEVSVARFRHDSQGALQEVIHERMNRMTLEDDNIRTVLANRARREFKRRPTLMIKQFPTGSLTVPELEGYLDGLERYSKFTPDLLIVDYPHLMKHNAANRRVELGQINEQIRGIGVRRNMATVVLSQGNRASETASTVTSDMLAEDISQLATADIGFTYSQTSMEKKLGLARMLLTKARNTSDGFSSLISQAYEIGQFCIDSTPLHGEYWDILHGKPKDGDEEDEDAGSSRRASRGRR